MRKISEFRRFAKELVLPLLVGWCAACGARPDNEPAAGEERSSSTSLASTTSAPSAECPNGDGSCTLGFVCANAGGIYSCVAPPGSNKCSDGVTVCQKGQVCAGNIGGCSPEDAPCSPFVCYATDGQVVVYDVPVGGPCEETDVHNVLHVCSTFLCSGGVPSTCLASSPPPSGGGDG
jgi:hypothetical protein